MSDGSTTLTESAPSSTQEIAATVIQEAERADTSSSEPGGYVEPTDTRNTVEEKPAPTPTPAELSAAAKFLEQQGHKAKTADGRDVWLKYTTVEKMLDNYVGTHRSTWDTEKGTLTQQAKEAREHLEQLRSAVAGDEEAFLRELAGIDTRYARFLQPVTSAPATVDDPEPQPDYPLGDGKFTYSIEGLAKREAWLERKFARALDAKLDERFKPIAEREKADKERAALERERTAAQTRAAEQIKEAEGWAGWNDHKEEILKALEEDTAEAKRTGGRHKLTLESAYRQVVMGKLLEDDNKRRERLLKEIKEAPKAPALARTTTDQPKNTGPRSTADIARDVIERAEKGA